MSWTIKIWVFGSSTNSVMKRFVPGCSFVFFRYDIFLKGSLKTQRNLVIIQYLHPFYTGGGGLESRKLSIKQKLLMVKAFNQNFSVSKTQFCAEFSKIWHSIFWDFLLFKLPKEIKDAKGNISMHYKTSLTINRLNLISYCNMDGRYKTTDTIKKRRLEAPKHRLHSHYR